VSYSVFSEKIDIRPATFLNSSAVKKNQHRWKKSLDDRTRTVIEDATETLKWSWDLDRESPESYPLNTSDAFTQIQQQLRGKSRRTTHTKLPPASPPPKNLSDLVDERAISAIYEDQNEGKYQDALKQAASARGDAPRVWRKILRAANAAYMVGRYGLDAIPKPKTHFLHRNLLDLLESKELDLAGLTLEGLVEFFNDICPCGQRHTTEAIRKLRERRARRHS
jgi:hypothetical protein